MHKSIYDAGWSEYLVAMLSAKTNSESLSTYVSALIILVGSATALFAIDGRSLWIDEIGTWLITRHDTLKQWWTAFAAYPDSDGQLPFYHFYMYFWTKWFGTHETTLRLANLPWFFVCLWAIWQASIPRAVAAAWIAFFSLNAFTWYYLNEARPYIVLLAGGTVLTSAWSILANNLENPRAHSAAKGIALYFVGAALLLGGSILGGLWVASTALAVARLYRRQFSELATAAVKVWWCIIPCLIVGSAIVAIAVASFHHGSRAATLGFSFSGVGYGIIEVLGLAGLGLGRNALRASVGITNLGLMLPMLAATLLAAAIIFNAARLLPSRILYPAAFASLAPIPILCLLGTLLGMRIVGRHFAVLLSPATLAFAAAACHALSHTPLQRAAVSLLVASLLVSTFEIRVAARHVKDDYAAAAAWVAPALRRGEPVWWTADPRGSVYYGLLPEAKPNTVFLDYSKNAPGSALTVDFSHLPLEKHVVAPSLIAYSKPDLYDSQGTVMQYIRDHKYREAARFAAFVIYASPDYLEARKELPSNPTVSVTKDAK